MSGVDGDCPTIPFGGDGDFTVSPDGRWLVYTAKVVDGIGGGVVDQLGPVGGADRRFATGPLS